MTQNPTPRCPVMTTTAGAPVVDNQNSLTAGPRGPVLMQDWHLLEKLAHQNRERIPERVVHAKGWGAFGTFTVTQDITRYTCASIFSEVGKVTPLVTRFSTVAGEMGAADAERDVRGFAVKFYTDQGNWDLVGNNTPVFFIRDPLKFPDFIHTQKRHPRTHLRSATAAWDFWSLSPESLHQVTILMSDRGIPASPRFMNGYGSHTYSLWNAQGERFWVKFHFKVQQGHRTLTNEEAEALIGKTRESYQEDLFNAIERGEFPKWTLYIQVMPEADAEKTPYNPFDLTKVWPHAAEPQPRQLFCRDRAGGHVTQQPGTRHWRQPRQGAAGTDLLVCRRPPLPPGHALRGAARQHAALPGASLPHRRPDELHGPQERRGRRLLRTELVRGCGAGPAVP